MRTFSTYGTYLYDLCIVGGSITKKHKCVESESQLILIIVICNGNRKKYMNSPHAEGSRAFSFYSL